MIGAPPSRTDWAIENIRRAILFGDVRAGERLISSAWSARLGVSQTPLREAFQRLAAEGFVDYDPQRGARVSRVTLRDACEIYELRILLEPRAVASAIAAATDAWHAELTAAYARVEELYATDDFVQPGAVEAHREFHRALRAGCNSSWLLRMTGMLADQSTRMQFASLVARGGHRVARTEHRELYAAARSGDDATAAALSTAHLQRTLDALRLDGR